MGCRSCGEPCRATVEHIRDKRQSPSVEQFRTDRARGVGITVDVSADSLRRRLRRRSSIFRADYVRRIRGVRKQSMSVDSSFVAASPSRRVRLGPRAGATPGPGQDRRARRRAAVGVAPARSGFFARSSGGKERRPLSLIGPVRSRYRPCRCRTACYALTSQRRQRSSIRPVVKFPRRV